MFAPTKAFEEVAMNLGLLSPYWETRWTMRTEEDEVLIPNDTNITTSLDRVIRRPVNIHTSPPITEKISKEPRTANNDWLIERLGGVSRVLKMRAAQSVSGKDSGSTKPEDGSRDAVAVCEQA